MVLLDDHFCCGWVGKVSVVQKILAFDMDGTILDSNERIATSILHVLHQAKSRGYIPVLASGRSHMGMIGYVEEAVDIFDYLICNNGSYLYDVKRKTFHLTSYVDKGAVLELMAIAKEQQSFFAVHFNDGLVERTSFAVRGSQIYENAMAQEWKRFDNITEEQLRKSIETKKITQASLRSTKEIISQTYKYVLKLQSVVDVRVANYVYLDINPRNISKLSGIETLGKKLNIPLENCIAFGDSGNDLEMLQGVGLGIAMGNATPEAKLAANIVIGDNDSNAIRNKVREIIGLAK